MLLIDDLLLGGLRFVFDKLATVVDQEMNDESRLHQTLMEAQMRFEMGEISAEEFAGIEQTVIDRLREIRAAREGDAPSLTDEGVRIGSVEISGPDADVDVEMPGVDVDLGAGLDAGSGLDEALAAKSVAARGSAKHAKSGQPRAARSPRARRASTKAAPASRRRARR